MSNKQQGKKLVILCAFPSKVESDLVLSIADTGEPIPKKSIPIYFDLILNEKFFLKLTEVLAEKNLRIIRLMLPFFIEKKVADSIKILFSRFSFGFDNIKIVFIKPNPVELFTSFYKGYLLYNKTDLKGVMLHPNSLADHLTQNEMLDSLRNLGLIYSLYGSSAKIFNEFELKEARDYILNFLGITPQKDYEFVTEEFLFTTENLQSHIVHPIFNKFLLENKFFEKPKEEREGIIQELISIQKKYNITSNFFESCPSVLDNPIPSFIKKINDIIKNFSANPETETEINIQKIENDKFNISEQIFLSLKT